MRTMQENSRKWRNDIKVDVEAIARGIYEMLDEDEKTCYKFGMLPAVKMEILEKKLKEKAIELFPSPEKIFSEKELIEMECIGLRKSSEELAQESRKEWVRETMQKVAVAMYGVAPMVV